MLRTRHFHDNLGPMKRFLVLGITFLVAACNSASGISAESSRTPAGNPNATVIIEEFADLQCPACAVAHPTVVKPLLEKYGSQIRYEFKHFPLRSIHRYALDASEASECAADQGKFWEYADLVYSNQDDLNFEALPAWAAELQLDTKLFDRCWKSHVKRDAVLADYSEGRDRGISSTPTFLVQGKQVEAGFDTLSAAIEEALKGSSMPL